MKFLIDECLSPVLAQLAIERDQGESSHMVWLGKAGWKDWDLIRFIVAGDWVFVTCSARDFHGRRGLHGKQAVHAGLVCLNAADGLDQVLQAELFELALDELTNDVDLVNQALEITLTENGKIDISRYDLPAICRCGASLDHPVRTDQERLRNRKSQGLGGLAVDHQFKFHRRRQSPIEQRSFSGRVRIPLPREGLAPLTCSSPPAAAR